MFLTFVPLQVPIAGHSFHSCPVNRQATVGAHRGARGASVAGVFQDLLGIVVPLEVDLLGKCQDMQGASYDTQVAALATLGVNDHYSFYFSHIVTLYVFELVYANICFVLNKCKLESLILCEIILQCLHFYWLNWSL